MEEIRQLLEITSKLRAKYKDYGKNFTIDGRLVGDIGEVLVAEKYGLELYSENTEKYDGKEKTTGREVQIKASFKGYFQFPYGEDKIPDYYLAVIIDKEGETHEVFNGPGKFVYDYYIVERGLKPYKNHYYTLSRGILKDLNQKVPLIDKIKKVK
jgi:hypothetical protein